MRKHFVAFSALAAAALLFPSCASISPSSGDDRLRPPQAYYHLPDKAADASEAVSNVGYWHHEVEKSLDRHLQAKGFTPAGQEAPLYVAFHVISQHGRDFALLDNYQGYVLSPKEQEEQKEIENFLTAPGAKDRRILIVDVIDAKRRQIIWRDWVQAPDKPVGARRTAKEQSRQIDRAVSFIMAKFPPR